VVGGTLPHSESPSECPYEQTTQLSPWIFPLAHGTGYRVSILRQLFPSSPLKRAGTERSSCSNLTHGPACRHHVESKRVAQDSALLGEPPLSPEGSDICSTVAHRPGEGPGGCVRVLCSCGDMDEHLRYQRARASNKACQEIVFVINTRDTRCVEEGTC
jgi:hypothetical protein